MKIAFASGKGGVGKSMLASSISVLLSKERKIIACDCDVDAPNLGIWLGVKKYERKWKISTSEKAFIADQEKCDEKIIDVCKFGAIEKINGSYRVNRFLCEGCGLCKILYKDAIEMKKVENAEVRVAKTKYGFKLFDAQLFPGESGSGKIVTELLKNAEKVKYDVMVIDSPAGIGCPVIASLKESDYVVLVSEPTPTGISDLKRIMQIVKDFGTDYGVVINKWNINESLTKKMEENYKDVFLGKISYNRKVIDCLSNMKTVVEEKINCSVEIKNIFIKLLEILQKF